jgi:hypothetical protein
MWQYLTQKLKGAKMEIKDGNLHAFEIVNIE